MTGEELREARKAAGLSMKQAAEYSNTPYRSWQDWEGGKRRVPGIAFSWLELWKAQHQGIIGLVLDPPGGVCRSVSEHWLCPSVGKGENMDLTKRYRDSNNNPCNIMQMVSLEQEWAANRIQEGEILMRRVIDAEMALDYYRSGLLKLTPDYVPSRVRLIMSVCGDGPFSSTRAAEGEYPCTSNRYCAISITAENGKVLGIKPAEFIPLEWIKNPKATFEA